MNLRNTALAAAAALALAGGLAGTAAQAPAKGNWPQWRGPDRTDVSTEKGLLKTWAPDGPRLVWKSTGLGNGNSTPSIANGRIYGLSYQGQDEVIWAVDEATGAPVWKTRLAAANMTIGRQALDGSGSTPTVDGDRIYTLGVSGDLVCLDLAGKIIWRKNLVTDFGGKVPEWGYSESPLVDGDRVIAAPGGKAATLVALDKATGAVAWKSQVPAGDGAQYASAIIADVFGERQYLQFLAGGVVGVAAKDGAFRWRYNEPANESANCPTPIFRDNHVFAATGYNHGGGLAKLEKSPNGITVKPVYFTKRMQNEHGGMVLVGDYLYGFDRANLTCLDFKSGEVKWFNRSVGEGSVTFADGHLYARGENGQVALVEATPAGYQEKSRFTPTDRSGKTAWPHPVVTGGRLYLRDQGALLCYDVKDPAAAE
ncbi:MAG: PQQ-binding-like beta-propeller repeat protein [Actinomycetota bacterium]